jgi:hypothetical protein
VNELSERETSPGERVCDEGILASARCGAGGEILRYSDRAPGGGVQILRSLTYLAAASIDCRGSCKSLRVSKPYLRAVAGMELHESAGSFVRDKLRAKARLKVSDSPQRAE